MVRKKREDIDHEFFYELANNTPHNRQFKNTRKVNTQKKHKKKSVMKEPDTGWSGIV